MFRWLLTAHPEGLHGFSGQGTMKLLLNVREAADALGVGRSMIYQLLAQGEIASVKIGNRRLIPDESVQAYVASLIGKA